MEVDGGSPTSTDISSQLRILSENALEANKAHQYALTRHAEYLMAKLQELDKLMDAVASDDIEDDIDAEVQIPGAIKAGGPCPVAEFLKPDSPFYEDASRRSQYLSDTVDHLMKTKELEALADAVKQENLRLKAYASQRSGEVDAEFDVENNTEGINWSIVAENVNKASGSTNRTADQCRIKWLGDRHPRINHGSWSPTELEKLKDLVSAQTQANEGKVNWVQVAIELGTNRTPIDCMRHGIQRQRHVWNTDADKRLADAVKLYGTYNWNIVARYVSEDATASQCQVRYSRVIDPSRKRGAWTDEEFARLTEAVAAYGSSWVEVAVCIPGRTNEQCRERWTEHLNLTSAGTVWTEEDDLALGRAVDEIGNRWKEISAKVGNGTTGQQCRTRWEKLKRLREQQQRAAAAAAAVVSSLTPAPETQPLAPKPRGRPRKKDIAAGNGAQEETATSAPSARPKPRPRPLGKGKGKAKVVEPDDSASISLVDSIPGSSADQTGQTMAPPAVSDAPAEGATCQKRALDETGEEVEVEAPSRKKRKTNKSHAATLDDTPQTPPKKVGRPRKKAAMASSTVVDTFPDNAGDGNAVSAVPDSEHPTPRTRPRLHTRAKSISPVESPADAVPKSAPPADGTKPDPTTSPQNRSGRSLRARKAVVSPGSEDHSSDDEESVGRVKTTRGRGRGRGRGRAKAAVGVAHKVVQDELVGSVEHRN